jgi:putative hemolysin
MSSSVLFEITVLMGLILLNGFFAMAELSVVAARRERMQSLIEDGNAGAVVAMQLSKDPTQFLSTVQIGITLIGILAGALGGASLAGQLAAQLEDLPLIGPYSQSISLAVVVGAITFLSVVIGELVPKRLALRNPERIAAAVSRPMALLSSISRPVVRLLTLTTEAILRLGGIRETDAETPVTEEEIKILMEQGAEAGVFEEAELDMVESIFRFGDRQLRSIMTPRTEVVWLDINSEEAEIREIVRQSPHSRLPVCDGSIDKVIGVVAAKDFLAHCWSDEPFKLVEMSQAPLFLPETMPALRALERFKQTGIQLAFLVDEFGGIEGVVTLFDMMEGIVGDIPTPEEITDPPVVTREDGSMLVEGYLAIDDLKELLGLEELPDEEDYSTLGGFVVEVLGHLPRVSDHFEWQGWRFEVVDMDRNRVDKVLIERPAANPNLSE